MPVEIIPAHAPEFIPTIRTLFREYEAWLGIDLCFQSFEEELAALPGAYAPPSGRLLLAVDSTAAAPPQSPADGEALSRSALGCICLRRISDEVCEMKRLFVRPTARGQKLGSRLAESLFTEARAAGYRRIRLDTLPKMSDAIRLYHSLGFTPIPPYYNSPIPGTLFLELSL